MGVNESNTINVLFIHFFFKQTDLIKENLVIKVLVKMFKGKVQFSSVALHGTWCYKLRQIQVYTIIVKVLVETNTGLYQLKY